MTSKLNRESFTRMSEAEGEVEGLRKALEQMLVDPPSTLDEPDTDAEVIMKMREIARAALTTGGKQ